MRRVLHLLTPSYAAPSAKQPPRCHAIRREMLRPRHAQRCFDRGAKFQEHVKPAGESHALHLRASLESPADIFEQQQQLERVNRRRLELEVCVESARCLINGVHHHRADCNDVRSLLNPRQSVE